MDFDNVEEMYSYAQKQILVGSGLVGEYIKNMLRDYVDTMWYSAHTPEQYQRTMEFINSISVKNPILIGNTINIEVFFDTSKIHANETNGIWNQHMSMSKEDVSEKIPYFIEEGNGSKIYNYNGIHMTERVKERCIQENIPLKLMLEHLQNNGIDCAN